MKSLRIAFASLALLVIAGCSKEPVAKCPACGQAAVATVAQVAYEGKQVGFCCDKCAAAWNGMDAPAKKAAYDKNMK
jgi:hypothetical protein